MAEIKRHQPPEEISINTERVIDGYSWEVNTRFTDSKDVTARIEKPSYRVRDGCGYRSPGSCLRIGAKDIPELIETLQEFMEALESIDD